MFMNPLQHIGPIRKNGALPKDLAHISPVQKYYMHSNHYNQQVGYILCNAVIEQT